VSARCIKYFQQCNLVSRGWGCWGGWEHTRGGIRGLGSGLWRMSWSGYESGRGRVSYVHRVVLSWRFMCVVRPGAISRQGALGGRAWGGFVVVGEIGALREYAPGLVRVSRVCPWGVRTRILPTRAIRVGSGAVLYNLLSLCLLCLVK
jgi:hypothetical protein